MPQQAGPLTISQFSPEISTHSFSRCLVGTKEKKPRRKKQEEEKTLLLSLLLLSSPSTTLNSTTLNLEALPLLPTSVLVLFRGLPGVGKSTLARSVARELKIAPLVDKDDTRDALAEVFEEGDEEKDDKLFFREKLNEASYAAAFNAARTLLVSSRCPCVLLDSPLSRASTAERALRLAEELKELREEGSRSSPPPPPPLSPLLFVVVAVGSSDERSWRGRLEARARALEGSGSLSARHKPREWKQVEALRDRGRKEAEEARRREEEEEEEKNIRGEGEDDEQARLPSSSSSSSSSSSFREQMLRDLGVDNPSAPFSRLWEQSFARFVVDTGARRAGGAGEGEKEDGGAATTEAAAKRVAAAVRGALAGSKGNNNNAVVFID